MGLVTPGKVRSTSNALWLGLALLVLPSLALVGAEIYQITAGTPDLRHSQDLVIHTFEVIGAAQALDRAVQDADHGQRTARASGHNSYLELYRSPASPA